MIHRKLQNVVYMKKSRCSIKKNRKKREQHRVLSTSTCGCENLHRKNKKDNSLKVCIRRVIEKKIVMQTVEKDVLLHEKTWKP